MVRLAVVSTLAVGGSVIGAVDVAQANTLGQQVTVADTAGHRLATTSTARSSVITPNVEASIVCGGQKHGSGWYTLTYGGYVGQGCGAGTDHVATPTSSYSIYDFGISDGSALAYQAWIPVNADADALMDYTLYVCGVAVADTTVDQAPIVGWVDLFDPNNKFDIGTLWYWSVSPGCDVQVKAWTGALRGEIMGLDAIRTLA